MSKKLVCHSGGIDSTALMLEYVEKYGADNVVSLGFNYGQRHFERENKAARKLCAELGVARIILDIPISQIGGCSLIDKNIPVTTDMNNQRSTVVPQRNAIFMLFAAAYAQENDCDEIVHGAIAEDEAAYRDCRPEFFRLLEMAIQAGRTQPIKGSEDITKDMNINGRLFTTHIDIKLSTPLINEKKEDTVKRIIGKFGVEVYKNSYTCYNGGKLACGKCPACVERINAFKINNAVDPMKYEV
jgi:7-cyano-7-deazaguanine synthase